MFNFWNILSTSWKKLWPSLPGLAEFLSFFWAGIEPVKIKYEYLDEKKNFQKQIWLIFYVVYKEYLTL